MGDALAQHRRRNRGAVLRHRGAGLVDKATLHRHGVEHDVGGYVGNPANIEAGADGVQIGNTGAAGYQNQIGGTGSGKRSIGGMGRRVDHHEADATGAGSTEHATDARRVGAVRWAVRGGSLLSGAMGQYKIGYRLFDGILDGINHRTTVACAVGSIVPPHVPILTFQHDGVLHL